MRKTLVVLLALLILGSAPSVFALAPDENPSSQTTLIEVLELLETVTSWLGISRTEEPGDGDDGASPVGIPEGDGEASSEPGSGGEAGPGWDPQG